MPGVQLVELTHAGGWKLLLDIKWVLGTIVVLLGVNAFVLVLILLAILHKA